MLCTMAYRLYFTSSVYLMGNIYQFFAKTYKRKVPPLCLLTPPHSQSPHHPHPPVMIMVVVQRRKNKNISKSKLV